MIPPSQPSRPSQARRSEAPPRSAQRVQTAKVEAPSVSTTQSAQTIVRQRAHGPEAGLPQRRQLATGPSPEERRPGT